jgi:transcriptional regulator with XRE-family HTH domain
MDLVTVRLTAGLTVAALAREAKIDRRTVEKAEAGEPISLVKATAIAVALSRVTGQTYTVSSLGIVTS